MIEWQNTYGAQGLKIIAIAQQPVLGDLQGTISELGINYQVAEDDDRDTWDAYGIRAYPSWAFIDASGSLVHRQVGIVVVDQAVTLIEQSLGG